MLKLLRKANIARDKEWNPNKLLSLSFRGNELGGEVGEAQNILKKLERERLGLVGSRSTPEKLAEELADVMICVDLIAMEFGLNMEAAIAAKFNKTSRERGLSVMLPEGNTPRPKVHGTIAVDLDGTLARYDKWVAWNVIGPIIEPMKQRILTWLAEGKEVVIFTARAGYDTDTCRVSGFTFTRDDVVAVVQGWLEANGLPRLAVTHEKTDAMIEIWDDRAVQVVSNTGATLAEEHAAELAALQGAP